jgi:hypothetical protein
MMQSAPTQRSVSQSPALEEAIAALRSFQHGDRGILDVIRCGALAIPLLRAMLFERERSGLFQTRCRVVQALAALDAYDVLIEFLKANRTIADPVERVGEDAVINAAALALANVRKQGVFELLLRLAQRSALTGVIGALGGLGRVEAIPVFIDALEEDASRHTAETALWKLGKKASPALLSTVDLKLPCGRESESSARRRRSALKLLAEMERSRAAWRRLRHLMRDDDAPLAARACEIGLTRGSASERTDAVRRLIELLPQKDWVLREEIEAYLTIHLASAREVIAQYLNQNSYSPRDDIVVREQTEIILRRIIARATPAEAR